MELLGIVCRVILVYLLLIILLRFLGKREVGELSIFDLVVILIVADIASIGIDNKEFFIPAIVCLLVLAGLQKLLSFLLLKNRKLREVVDGKPSIIVSNGHINLTNMKKELYSMDDLITQMRENGVSDISEIRLGILETNGTLSIIKKDNKSIRVPIIISGKYVIENLECINFDREFIDKIMSEKCIKVNKILYASCSEDGVLYYYINNNNKEELSMHKLCLGKRNK